MIENDNYYGGRFFEIRSPEVPMGSYWVCILPPKTKTADQVKKDDLIPIFFGETMAEDLFAPHIVKDLAKRGGVVGILMNEDEPTTFLSEDEE